MVIKIILLLLLAFSFILYLIVPRTRLADRLRMSESFYYAIHVIGMLSGLTGIVVTLIYPEKIMTDHLYELILLPVFFVYLYSAVLIRIKKGEDIYDEKQNRDIISAIAISWVVSFFGMFFMYALFTSNALQGFIWYPLYVFVNILIFSSSTLVLFKRS